MKKNLYYLYTFLVIILGSCNKDLDRFPQTSISPDVFFNTEEDLSLYINGLLSLSSRSSYLGDQSTDNAATTAAVEIKTIMTGTTSSQNITSGWDWSRLRNINYFLENYKRANVTDDVKAHYAGLARYYRALFYHDKVKRFSDVPWYSGTLNPGDETLFKTQDPRKDVMDSVMADLDYAASHVKVAVPVGTPGKWVVALWQAKVALYEGTYRKYHPELNLQATADDLIAKAASVAEDIMKNSGYKIYSNNNPDQDYASLFNSANLVGNPEVMLVNAFDQSKNVTQNVNGNVFGDYEQSPSRDLVQTYLMKDGKPFTDQSGYQKFEVIKEFTNRDPRMKQTLLYPGWVYADDTTGYVVKLNKKFTGYYQLKGYVNSKESTVINSVDFPVHRFADVLLIMAEAKAELGILTQEDLDKTVNLLRDRVGMPHLQLSTSNSNPDPIQAAKYPDVSGANKGVILEVRRERRVEYAFENSRYDDLMRWHAGKLLETIPEGMYFPGLGDYDITGDGITDIRLVPIGQSNPANPEKNSLNIVIKYFSIGPYGGNADVYLQNGSNGGVMMTDNATRTFIDPQYYYRPIPYTQISLNPNLKQPFGWK